MLDESSRMEHANHNCVKARRSRRIPIYIVQEQHLLDRSAAISSNDLTKSHNAPIYRYAATDDHKNVLLAYKGQDGQLYTIGP